MYEICHSDSVSFDFGSTIFHYLQSGSLDI